MSQCMVIHYFFFKLQSTVHSRFWLDICNLQGLVESYRERSIEILRSIKQAQNFFTKWATINFIESDTLTRPLMFTLECLATPIYRRFTAWTAPDVSKKHSSRPRTQDSLRRRQLVPPKGREPNTLWHSVILQRMGVLDYAGQRITPDTP